MRVTCYLVALLLLPASAFSQEALPEGVTETTIDEGRALYMGTGICFACHGTDGRGVPGAGPDLTDDEWWNIDLDFAELLRVIRQGVAADQSRTGAYMPPKGGSQITDEQVAAVAAYVWSLSRTGSGPTTPPGTNP
ncbi:MAG: cytochrome c [Gemmatimonadetes bacterium]|nr:cytochrome c [Gemmatimonadota bacterium]MBT8478875.1 cytochrome c [Gemmatimonadota bacterium]